MQKSGFHWTINYFHHHLVFLVFFVDTAFFSSFAVQLLCAMIIYVMRWNDLLINLWVRSSWALGHRRTHVSRDCLQTRIVQILMRSWSERNDGDLRERLKEQLTLRVIASSSSDRCILSIATSQTNILYHHAVYLAIYQPIDFLIKC